MNARSRSCVVDVRPAGNVASFAHLHVARSRSRDEPPFAIVFAHTADEHLAQLGIPNREGKEDVSVAKIGMRARPPRTVERPSFERPMACANECFVA